MSIQVVLLVVMVAVLVLHVAVVLIYTRGKNFLVRDYWGFAAGWGRIFTTGLTIMGLHF